MKLEIKFAGLFAECIEPEKRERVVGLPEDITVSELLDFVDIDFEKTGLTPTVIVNGKTYKENCKLKAGDRVIILNLLNGG